MPDSRKMRSLRWLPAALYTAVLSTGLSQVTAAATPPQQQQQQASPASLTCPSLLRYLPPKGSTPILYLFQLQIDGDMRYALLLHELDYIEQQEQENRQKKPSLEDCSIFESLDELEAAIATLHQELFFSLENSYADYFKGPMWPSISHNPPSLTGHIKACRIAYEDEGKLRLHHKALMKKGSQKQPWASANRDKAQRLLDSLEEGTKSYGSVLCYMRFTSLSDCHLFAIGSVSPYSLALNRIDIAEEPTRYLSFDLSAYMSLANVQELGKIREQYVPLDNIKLSLLDLVEEKGLLLELGLVYDSRWMWRAVLTSTDYQRKMNYLYLDGAWQLEELGPESVDFFFNRLAADITF